MNAHPVLLAVAAAAIVTSLGAQAAKLTEGQLRYQQERAACMKGETGLDFIRSVPAVYLAMLGGALVCALVAVAAHQGEWLRAPTAVAKAHRTVSADAGESPKAQARRRCESCGFVESIRHIQQVGNVPGTYEFTVRLKDGSARTSSDPSASRWQAGDRVMLIGGKAATN